MSHHLLKLCPTDVLFFRDGRPMEGSSSGKGAAWPLPNVLSAAIHHAMRRADLADLHQHRPARNGKILDPDCETKGREFGSLQTAGPFPVVGEQWLFPRPSDADKKQSAETTHCPMTAPVDGSTSSLTGNLCPVVSKQAPSKDKAERWITAAAYTAYLNDSPSPGKDDFFNDEQLFAAEHNIGIGIDPDTDSQDGERFYSASYLRLKSGVQLGLIGHCMDKGSQSKAADHDLIAETFPNSNSETHILAGGQQRTCTVKRETRKKLPLPLGPQIEGKRVRWTLLTPAIFPHLSVSDRNTTEHPGGWLPTWVHPETMKVQLKDPQASVRGSESREGWRQRVSVLPAIDATLVATSIPRAVTVTGWALSDSDDSGNIMPGGARATHLAVPAGAVYYFEASSEEDARKLADALNWHGLSNGSEIQNRRSSLMGEKGFGLGVCSDWHPHTL
jgi:CRISPR type III-B/RAMP module-associated protein Cmr3